MAVYALARGFAGCDWLIGIGAVMVVFPLVHAVLADDLRRVLTHVLNNQLGFMVVAVGIGTPLAINGAAAQAFAHVIYKSLLFMALGAVLHRTGSARQTQLSGLARMMPWTCAFCLIGAWSVAPLNCGFVTKSIIVSAALDEHLTVVWLVLLVGGVGAFLTAGMKVPYFTFFGGPASHDVQEAPRHMLAAMGAAAALCLGIGIAPGVFYRLLPNPMEYQPYDVGHVVTQLQTMAFTGCAFVLALRIGWYPRPATGTLLDFDWTYRRAVPALTARIMSWRRRFGGRVQMATRYAEWWGRLTQQCGEGGVLGRSVSTNAMAIAAIILLAVYLFLFYP
jgi:multicomponent Na+:H+ antiporter subunit D